MFCKSILKILQIASFLIFVYATTKKGLIVVAIDYIDFNRFADTQIDILTCSALVEIIDCYDTNLEEEIKQYTNIADAISTEAFNFRHIVMSHIINYFANGMPERDDYESILFLNEKCYDEDWKQKFVAKLGNNTERIDNNYVRRLIYCYVTAADKFRKSKVEFLRLYREAQKAKIRDLINLKQNYGHKIIFINRSTHLEILKSIYEYSIANPGTILDSVQVYLDTTLLSVDILSYIFNEAAINAMEKKKHNGIQGFINETIEDYIKQLRNTDGFAANVANTYRRILVHNTRFVLFSNFLFAYIEVYYFMSIAFSKPHNYTMEEAKNCLTGIYKTIQHKYCAYIDSERRIMLGLQKIENRAHLQIINNNTLICLTILFPILVVLILRYAILHLQILTNLKHLFAVLLFYHLTHVIAS